MPTAPDALEFLKDTMLPGFLTTECGCDNCDEDIPPGPCYTYRAGRVSEAFLFMQGDLIYCVPCAESMIDMWDRQASRYEQ